jgi:hypothetical protein
MRPAPAQGAVLTLRMLNSRGGAGRHRAAARPSTPTERSLEHAPNEAEQTLDEGQLLFASREAAGRRGAPRELLLLWRDRDPYPQPPHRGCAASLLPLAREPGQEARQSCRARSLWARRRDDRGHRRPPHVADRAEPHQARRQTLDGHAVGDRREGRERPRLRGQGHPRGAQQGARLRQGQLLHRAPGCGVTPAISSRLDPRSRSMRPGTGRGARRFPARAPTARSWRTSSAILWSSAGTFARRRTAGDTSSIKSSRTRAISTTRPCTGDRRTRWCASRTRRATSAGARSGRVTSRPCGA